MWLTQALHLNSHLIALPLSTLSNTVLLLPIWHHLTHHLFHLSVPLFSLILSFYHRFSLPLSFPNSPSPSEYHALICPSFLNMHPSITLSFLSFINLCRYLLCLPLHFTGWYIILLPFYRPPIRSFSPLLLSPLLHRFFLPLHHLPSIFITPHFTILLLHPSFL